MFCLFLLIESYISDYFRTFAPNFNIINNDEETILIITFSQYDFFGFGTDEAEVRAGQA